MKSRIKIGIILYLSFSVLFFTLGNVSYPLVPNNQDYILSFQILNFIMIVGLFIVCSSELLGNVVDGQKKRIITIFVVIFIATMLYDIDIVAGTIVIFTNVSNTLGFYYGSLIKIVISLSLCFIALKLQMKSKLSVWIMLATSAFFCAPVMVNFLLVSQLYIDLLLLILLAVGYDIFGYFGGSFFGKTRIFPKLSPNKTLAGTTTGVLGATFGTFILYGMIYLIGNETYPMLLKGPSTIYSTILFLLFFTFFASTGDLLFSKVKRILGIKDFSNLLSSHGGVLDRLDSILPVIGIFAIFSPVFTTTII